MWVLSHGGPELLLLLVIFIVTPLISPWLPKGRKLRAAALLWFATAVAGYWDVVPITVKARHLCKTQAGLHVYKTVEAEGFVGDSGIEYWSKVGFKYVETDGKEKIRYTIVDGQVKKEKIQEFASRYQFASETKLLEAPFERETYFIRDRQTGEILGDIVAFYVYPGWLDSHLLGSLGFSWSPPRCDGDFLPLPHKSTVSIHDLITAVLKPKG